MLLIINFLIIFNVLLPTNLTKLSNSEINIQATKLIKEADYIFRGESSASTLIMEVSTKRFKRSLKIKSLSLNEDYVLIKILEPAKDKGVSTLKRKNEIWNYLPKIQKTIKIPSSLMGSAWMGSHFTNDDLVKDVQLYNSYNVKFVGRKKINDTDVAEFKLTSKPKTVTVYDSILYYTRLSDNLPVKQVFIDEKGVPARTFEFQNYKNLGGKLLPSIIKVTVKDKPDEYTKLEYLEISFNIKLNEDSFSIANLQK